MSYSRALIRVITLARAENLIYREKSRIHGPSAHRVSEQQPHVKFQLSKISINLYTSICVRSGWSLIYHYKQTREIEAETEASRKTASGHLAQQENFLPIKLLTICGVTRRDRVPATSLIENQESENACKLDSERKRRAKQAERRREGDGRHADRTEQPRSNASQVNR